MRRRGEAKAVGQEDEALAAVGVHLAHLALSVFHLRLKRRK